MKKVLWSVLIAMSVMFGFADQLWENYKDFADGRYGENAGTLANEKARKAYFADTFYGNTATLKGTFKATGKATLGGQYVSVDVDGKSVKIMIRPSEKGKVAALSKGDVVTFTGVYKSRGDLMHCVTFEDGVISTGSSAPVAAANTSAAVDSSAIWSEYVAYSNARLNGAANQFSRFDGKTIQLSGTFKKTGKAVLGGQYVSVDVGGKSVKFMIRPSEKGKLSRYSKGSSITLQGTFKSEGDLMHIVTFEDSLIK